MAGAKRGACNLRPTVNRVDYAGLIARLAAELGRTAERAPFGRGTTRSGDLLSGGMAGDCSSSS